jgi:dTDP-4-amino-4,6-dideoxygalactose transaminase
MAYLCDRQIGCAVHYPMPVHRQLGYAERAILPRGGLPVTDRICSQILSLPMYPELSDDNVDEVVASVRDASINTPPSTTAFERVPSR